MTATKSLVAVATSKIVRIVDASHPLFDPRSTRTLDEYTLADYRERGQQTPIAVISLANAEALGASFEGGDYAIIYGNGRHTACEAVGIEFMMAFVEEIDSLATFLTLKMRENSIRDEETFDQLLTKAKLVADALLASGVSRDDIAISASVSLRKPVSTVKDLLKLSDPEKTAPALREMIKADEIDYGAAKQILTLPAEVQPEAVAELAKMQAAALDVATKNGKLAEAAASPGKEVRVKTENGDTATVKVDQNGDVKVKPSQDSTQKAKAKVQNKAAPASTKTEAERKAPVALDLAMISGHKARVAMLRRLPGHNFADIVAGAELLAAMASGQAYELPADASEALKAAHAFLFSKAE